MTKDKNTGFSPALRTQLMVQTNTTVAQCLAVHRQIMESRDVVRAAVAELVDQLCQKYPGCEKTLITVLEATASAIHLKRLKRHQATRPKPEVKR